MLACIDTPKLKGPKAKSIEAKESKYFLNNLVAYKHISLKKLLRIDMEEQLVNF